MDYIFETINFVRNVFDEPTKFIPLHAPRFDGNEKKYLLETIDSTFVSSVGAFTTRFEQQLAAYTGAGHAVVCVNGTCALHMALLLCGVRSGEEVLSQALTFIATANAISYVGAVPVFVDVDRDTLGMSPEALRAFLESKAERRNDATYNRETGRKIAACVPMHTFGLPCRIDQIAEICQEWNITLVEDSAESIGSFYQGKHTGTTGRVGVFSFNGNKTITCGGGGALITNDEGLASRARHLTQQAKVPHPWNFIHDEIGYNYRMPNLNAALACAQLEQLDGFLVSKRNLAKRYKEFFQQTPFEYVDEIDDAHTNYWLNAVLLPDLATRDEFLAKTNDAGVMTRPIWHLMTSLKMFEHCQHDGLENSRWLGDRLVNLPSSVR